MRKGQHLALESAATFGLTLIAAIGVIQTFNMINKDVIDTTGTEQGQIASDRVRTSMVQMSYLSGNDRGFKQLELTEKAGSKDYSISIEDGEISVYIGEETLVNKLNIAMPSENVEGSIDGGSVRLFKNLEGYSLREGR